MENQDNTEIGTATVFSGSERNSINNSSIMPDAGQVKLNQYQGFAKGVLVDMKRTVGTHWKEEMTNFNQKTIAVTLLVLISVIAPTLTFGAVYGKVTENNIGAIETIIATSWVGVAYSLIGGMPIVRIIISLCTISLLLLRS